MTDALVLDPVTATAVTNRITEWVGLGNVDLRLCEYCAGTGGTRKKTLGVEWYGECGVCDGSGRVVPQAGTYLIASTNHLPEEWTRYGDYAVRLYTDGGWRLDNCMGDTLSRVYPLPVGQLLGAGWVEFLPVTNVDTEEKLLATKGPAHTPTGYVSRWANREPALVAFPDGSEYVGETIDDSLPFSDWSTNLCANITNLTPTIRGIDCPHCLGYGRVAGIHPCECGTGWWASGPLPYAAPDRPCVTTIDLTSVGQP